MSQVVPDQKSKFLFLSNFFMISHSGYHYGIIVSRILLAICLLYSLSAQADNEQISNPKKEATQTTQSSNNTAKIELKLPVVNYPALDLTEQRRMADATEKMAEDSGEQLKISGRNLWIGIGGFIILLVALIFNIRAANAAKHAADAALAQASQNRAWIFVSNATTHLMKNQEHPFIIEIVGHNYGQSPAISLEIQTGYIFLDSAIEQTNLNISLDEEVHPFGSVGQGIQFKKSFSIMNTDDLKSICADGDKALYIRIFIKYLTIHNQVATSDNIIRVNYLKKFADLELVDGMRPEDFPANVSIVPGYTVLT